MQTDVRSSMLASTSHALSWVSLGLNGSLTDRVYQRLFECCWVLEIYLLYVYIYM
jgi:hypothetical protein